MLQLRSASVANTEPLEIAAPFMSQITFSPVAPLRHRMSDLPSPSKSPTPVMLQLRSVTVAKLVAPPEIVVPFMSQIEFEPVTLLCHRMSDLPSPSKSPIPTMLQLRSVTAPKTGWLKIVAPFMNQIEISPVAPLRHRMSDLPSPSKSPTPVMLQLRSVTVAKLVAPPEIVVPFMSQIEFEPVAPLRHRMSDLPSPSKSPTPTMLQLRSVTAAKLVAPPEIVVPFMSQIEFE